MKKMMMVSLTLLALLAFAGNAVATTVENTNPGDPVVLDPVNSSLEMTFSPSVKGLYGDDGQTGADIQWYVIGSYHSGGTYMYGTAQSLTKTYKREWLSTENTKSFSKLPSTKANATSESQWTTTSGFKAN